MLFNQIQKTKVFKKMFKSNPFAKNTLNGFLIWNYCEIKYFYGLKEILFLRKSFVWQVFYLLLNDMPDTCLCMKL